MALTNAAQPVITNTGESLSVDPISGAVIGIDAAANEVALSQTGSENKVQISQTVGENVVELGSAIAISQAGTENQVQLSQASGDNGVDIVKVGGNAVTTSIPVSITSAGATVKDTGTTTIAAGNPSPTTGTINFIDIGTGTTGHLLKLFGFAQFQVQIKVKGTDNAEFVFTGNGSGGGPINLDLPYGAMTQAGGTGKRWEVTATNLHKNAGVDVDLTAVWVQV
jgi:hypothetical protein